MVLARRSRELARAGGQSPAAAEALRLLGEVHAASEPPPPGSAESCYREALAIAEGIENRPLVARCHLSLGQLYRRTGQREKAREHLMTAVTMLREMDMRFWLERPEAELSSVE